MTPVVNPRRVRIGMWAILVALVALVVLDTWAVDSMFHGIYSRAAAAALSSFTVGLVIGSGFGRIIIGRWLTPRDYARTVRYLFGREPLA